MLLHPHFDRPSQMSRVQMSLTRKLESYIVLGAVGPLVRLVQRITGANARSLSLYFVFIGLVLAVPTAFKIASGSIWLRLVFILPTFLIVAYMAVSRPQSKALSPFFRLLLWFLLIRNLAIWLQGDSKLISLFMWTCFLISEYILLSDVEDSSEHR